ncbi:MAG: hypothetical protein RI902_1012 [Pseudomonadota bacterium]|jgi:hypothetical protein
MYNAPSVAYPVGRCAFQRWVFVGLFLASLCVMAAWAAYQPLTWFWYAAWLPVALGCVGAWRAMQAHGVLQWQGETWVLWLKSSHDNNPWQGGALRLAFDAQRVLLLQWTPSFDEEADATTTTSRGVSRRSEWVWLSKDNAPEHWQDLRRAVHAQALVH